ncbi:acyl-CoA dehydrogenase family protein [Echinicola jeungdonensis]|uniref:Acyl-CoA dehydrogenase family protein n=1 Tax=Echinicola jeungdonensis TaxID=709343 RepID=A0ABV5J3W3_9BACT|nr:acyl-CoA dehydrogenase family protein [Echinicola jeungdonensis]MDN3670659.1 acyl-CoA dehydrogenase family protein [Echinicola jeungdonensis]
MKNTASSHSSKTERSNRVLDNQYQPSKDFWESDLILSFFLKKEFPEETWNYLQPFLSQLGKTAATIMDELSLTADKHGPVLKKRNHLGETVNEIVFHPYYNELLKIAVESGLFKVKWSIEARKNHGDYLHRMGFGLAFLYGMGDASVPCPLCMTDGAARLIDRYGRDEDKGRLLPHIYADLVEELYTGAMFLTEKIGGSDVGANLVEANHQEGDYYLLNGEKWFCSNANADLILVLARTKPEIEGTKGLSIFLVERQKPDGTTNEMDVIRLKEKLGVRSMASAEILLTDTLGKRLGKEGEGFKIMTDMINLSRLWNAVIAISSYRRCLVEAYQFLSHRQTFGKKALEHALVRTKLEELIANYLADFYLTWKTIRTLDEGDNGNEKSRELVRILTPMVKKKTAETAVYGIRESMELMGGLGYIEDTVIPKFMRDTLVLPIWEGAGNIMVLDMLRAIRKSDGLSILYSEMYKIFNESGKFEDELNKLENLMGAIENFKEMDQDSLEASAKGIFEDLTRLYQIALLKKAMVQENEPWILPTIEYLQGRKKESHLISPLSVQQVKGMMGWR